MRISKLKLKTIGILMGGTSSEREISLKTGQAIYAALKRQKFKAVAIDVGKNIAIDLIKHKIDVAFIALHGPLGEDGTIQGMLEILHIPYTGSRVLASALAMDKLKSKEIFVYHKIPTPRWQSLKKNERVKVEKYPVVVKPCQQGSAIGVTIVEQETDLAKALKLAFRFNDTVIVEDYIKGKELTVGVLNDRALPVIEIIPQNKFYDFESKYAIGGSKHLIPASISSREQAKAQSLALATHNVLGCRGATRVDLLLDTKGRFFVLEVNTIPGMTETSLLPDAAKAAGLSFEQLVIEILSSAF